MQNYFKDKWGILGFLRHRSTYFYSLECVFLIIETCVNCLLPIIEAKKTRSYSGFLVIYYNQECYSAITSNGISTETSL